jgi:aspartate aminotransferase
VLLNSPNNPSGAVYDEDFVRGLVRLCEEKDVFLLMDDIYHRLVFDGGRAVHAYECTDRDLDDTRIVVLNGVSKQYAMTGFRIGWAVGPAPLIKAMGNIQSHQTGGPSTLSQTAAIAALAGSQDSVDELRRTLQDGRDELVRLLREIPGLEVETPGGTFYGFCDFGAYDRDSARLAAYLLDKVQVVTVPGAEFGMDGYLRLSYCGPVEDVREGVRRIAWALDKDGPAELRAGDRVFTR